MQRSAFSILSILFVSALLFSCRRTPEHTSDFITVDFWHSMGSSHGKLIEGYVNEFQKQNPAVRINAVYQGNYAQLFQKLIAGITAGNVPTMSQLYESWTVRLIRRDHLEPVESFFSHPEYGLSRDEVADIVKNFRENNTYNNIMVTMPFNKSAYMLFLNMDILKRAGIDEPPRTWQEMRETARKCTSSSGTAKPIYGFATRPFIEAYSPFLYISNHRFIDDNGNLVFAEEPGKEALQFLVDMLYEDKAGYIESDYLSTPFGAGRIAMFIGSTAGIPFIEKGVMNSFEWRVAPIPSPSGEQGRVLFQGTNLGIFANNPDDEKLMGWRFLKFLTDTPIATNWAIESGYLPVRYSCIEQPEMKELLEKNPNYRVVLSQIDYGIFEPREPYWELIRNEITDQVEAVLNGRRPVNEALEKALHKCKLIMDSLKS